MRMWCHKLHGVYGHVSNVVHANGVGKMYYVYILKSERDGRCYTGRSSNLKRRIKEHKSGNVISTKRMLPVKLVFYEAFLSEEDSVRREKYLKTTKGKSSLKQIIRESLTS